MIQTKRIFLCPSPPLYAQPNAHKPSTVIQYNPSIPNPRFQPDDSSRDNESIALGLPPVQVGFRWIICLQVIWVRLRIGVGQISPNLSHLSPIPLSLYGNMSSKFVVLFLLLYCHIPNRNTTQPQHCSWVGNKMTVQTLPPPPHNTRHRNSTAISKSFFFCLLL